MSALRSAVMLALFLATACAGSASRPVTGPAASAPAPTIASAPLSPFGDEASAPRARAPLTILQINDVYSISPIEGRGGLARVAALKHQVAAAGRAPLFILAGDFLSPSVASSVFKGAQMVAALNAAGLDIATFGNHEFDFGADVLRERIKESRWTWLNSNVVEQSGRPMEGTVPFLVRTFGDLRVGFIGLCLTTNEIKRNSLGDLRLLDPLESAAKYLAVLREERVDAIVAVTHLTLTEDQALVERFPEIDLVIGGHEHSPVTVTQNRTLISKAGSEAEFVARIDLARRGNTLDRHFELIPIDGRLPDEPGTARVIADYEKRLGTQMDTVIAASLVDLDAVAQRLRTGEAALGNLVADAVRASVDADVALVNSGAIRGDRVYPAGAWTRRTLLAMHPFGNVVVKVAMTGRLLLETLNHGMSRLPAAAGQFPQVSGLTIDVYPTGTDRVRNVRVGGEPLNLDRPYTVGLLDFLLTGGDGYSMFARASPLVSAEAGELLVSVVERHMSARRTVSPTLEKRINIVRQPAGP